VTARLRPPGGTWARAILVVAAVGLALVAGLVAWAEHQMNPAGAPGPPVDVDIPMGTSTHGIANLLASRGVISNSTLFLVYLKLKGGGPFQAGVYSLHRPETYSAVVHDLSASQGYRLTVPEGFTAAQIADRVGHIRGHDAGNFLAVATGKVACPGLRSPYEPAGGDLEGLLFPDTYRINPDESDCEIARTMVDHFDVVARTIGLDRAPATVGLTPYQAVIVASMVEREAKLASDRSLVAEVIYNRLKRGMRLQVDATVLYAVGASRPGGPTAAELGVDSPYNTYRVAGLPPTPIASPGKAALEAALAPAQGDFLYYVVVQADGKEAFSPTLAGQDANIRLAQQRGLR